jgi:hypothetical protein
MVLNKEICIKCINSNRVGQYSEKLVWNTEDEWNWDHGLLECSKKFLIDIEKGDDSCLYRLEQIMINGKKRKNSPKNNRKIVEK